MRQGHIVLAAWTLLLSLPLMAVGQEAAGQPGMTADQLPRGSAPAPVAMPHFPDRLHAFVFKNWPLVPLERLAQVVRARPEDVRAVAQSMGLSEQLPISDSQWRRSYLTIIRRNWHLLPYEQLLELLDWSADKMAFMLREDDFLYVKLGNLKPKCEPLRYAPPDAKTQTRAAEIASVVQSFVDRSESAEPLFDFVRQLSESRPVAEVQPPSVFSPRFCYSYFALYGDPLLDMQDDPYPEGFLARLADVGVDGVWLQGVLYKLSPFPWQPGMSEGYEQRRENLRALVQRAARHHIRVYMYFNEPRSMPVSFFQQHPDLKGVVEGDWAALCTSVPAVQEWLSGAVADLCKAVPELGGIFTITGSENLTHCWSHYGGAACPRCGKRPAGEVAAEVNALIRKGIDAAGAKTQVIAWDWGWPDDWMEPGIAALPAGTAMMSVSEWSLPLNRGGIRSEVGEYSMSAIGPGPRACNTWRIAQQHHLSTIAKIQASTTWELGSVPYIPVLYNVGQQIVNLRDRGIDGLMLGWTLGGYPSPNLELVAELSRKEVTSSAPSGGGSDDDQRVLQAMSRVAERRFGKEVAANMVNAWRVCSRQFQEFPYHGGVLYSSPVHFGPSNPLWERSTGYTAAMVGIPYDHLTGWRAVYPPDVFAEQFEKTAEGFETALKFLRPPFQQPLADAAKNRELQREIGIIQACAIHWGSVANQTRFILARDALAAAKTADEARPHLDELKRTLESEIELARRLYTLQRNDSRIGFEASNHYFYIPQDLMEKVIICRDLLDRWLKAERIQRGLE